MSMQESAMDFLNTLIGQPLSYAIKSPDMDLYDFGFGEEIEVKFSKSPPRKVAPYTVHALCKFKIIRRNGKIKVFRYYEDTPYEVFHSEIKPLTGLKVSRVGLSEKNDLWLDFGGEYWVVFATHESEEESWRFFKTYDYDAPHLVVSALELDFQ